jgi:hypothetical protein
MGRPASQDFAGCCIVTPSWTGCNRITFVTARLFAMASDGSRYPWELSSLQRGLVDNCFEEGQYETAIATLDQLRSPDFNPHA